MIQAAGGDGGGGGGGGGMVDFEENDASSSLRAFGQHEDQGLPASENQPLLDCLMA